MSVERVDSAVCETCGDTGGHHTSWCARARATKTSDLRRGRALIEAIQNDDAQLVGRLLRGAN